MFIMFREATAIVVSVGFLAFFFSPANEEEKPVPVKVEKVKAPKANVSADDQCEVDDADETEEEFVFGEPMTSTDSYYSEDADDSDDEDGDDGRNSNLGDSSAVKSAATKSSDSSVEVVNGPQRNGPSHPDSPKAGERGSAENPVRLDQ